VTTLAGVATATPLTAVTSALRALGARRGPAAIRGIVPELIVRDPTRWTPASQLIDGTRLPDLLDAAKDRWGATPHAAAALAWKSYTYWLALPAVLGWASARRVPLLDPDDVLIQFTDHQPLVTVGFRRLRVAVLPSDPLVATGSPALQLVADETELLGTLRQTLLDGHLMPLLERLQEQVHVGQRTLLGSIASAVAYGVIRASDSLPGSTAEHVQTLLATLGVSDLVELSPGPGGLAVQRRTCCLAFTLPQPKVCSGCCIR
jgi:ferric iron reductase protein FhuF